MSTEDGGDPGQTSTGLPTTSPSPQLGKSKSILNMESHTVETHLLKELWFAKFIVKCPCALCWIMVGLLFLLLIIVMQIHTFSADDLAMTNRSFSVDTDHYTEYYDAYTLASEYVTDNDTDNETLVPQTEDIWSMTFYFAHKDYDDDMSSSSNYWIMDKENIELMIEYENMIMEDEDWLQKYCYAGEDPVSTNYSCSYSVSSIVRGIYESANYSSWSDDDIRNWIGDNLEYYYWYFNPDVDKYDDGTFDDLQIYRVRSFFSAGGPFATNRTMINNTWVHTSTFKTVGELDTDGYTREGDDYEDQSDILEEWAKPIWDDITFDEKGGYTDGDLNIIFIEDLNYGQAQLDQVNVSFIFFALAVIVVQMYMSYHLHSCCLGCGAMLQILLSFVLGFFWYRVIFWIEYSDFFTILVIFVLLGIGADDVFVFTDAWLQSDILVDSSNTQKNPDAGCCKDENEEANIMRMSFTFRRAASAMLTTQATTFFAFMATAVSELMTLKAFGYWAALVVAANYSLVITLYPAMLMIHHRWIKQYEDPFLAYTFCLCCTLCGKKDAPKEEPKPDAHESVPSDAPPVPSLTRTLSMKDGVGDGSDYRKMEQFLGRKWSAWIEKSKFYNLVAFFILFVVGISLAASQLEPDDDIFRTWKTSSWFYTLETVQSDFGESEDDGLLSLYITYGIEGVDRSDLKTFDKDDMGDIVWDDDFEMYTTAQQNYLYDTCVELKNSSMVYESPNSEYVRCPIMEWVTYLNASGETFPYDAGSKDAFAEKWSDFLDSDYAEDTIGYKLSWVEEDSSMIRFYAMYVDLPILFSATSTEGEQYRDDFDDYIDGNKEDCPDHLCDYMHNTSWRWWLLAVESNFLMSALSGIAVALPLAFVVLLISTRNWIISIFAIMDIIGVISCELCVIYIAGWQWGLTESIAVILVIGFSVDYVVHLANSYLESQGETRFQRLSFALLTMGVSVVSGAITTMLSGIMLVFPSYLFFYKMGWIIVTTVLLALMWALIFFPSMCAWIGPEGDEGDLTKYFTFCPCNKSEKEAAQQSADEGPKVEEGDALEMATKAEQTSSQ